MNNIKMLYFDGIDVSEELDVKKTSESKECDICHSCYFSKKGFKFQAYICNRCHDLLMTPNLNDIATLKINVKKIIMLLLTTDFTEKSET